MTDQAAASRVIWLGTSLSVLCLLYFCALDRFFFSSLGFSPIFRFLLAPDANTAWLAAAIVPAAVLWQRPAPILRIVEFLGERPRWVALCCVLLFSVGAITLYHDYPLSMDEYAAVFQSKIFAAGHLYARLPRDYVDWLIVRGFNGEFLIASRETGRVIEEYWPGFALLLSPFQFLHIPWACNALLSGLALLLIHGIAREITGEQRAAGWALLFALASGAFVADGISYYAMQAHLTVNLLFVALLLRPTPARALGAGLAGSLALNLHNPVPHALFALPWLIAMALDRQQRRYLIPLLLGYLPGLVLGLSWLLLRADIASSAQPLSSLKGSAAVFTWPDASLFNMRAASTAKMWVWAVPCLYLLAVFGWLRHRDNRQINLLAASAAATFFGYVFVHLDQGHGWGFRYFHAAFGTLPILAAAALTGPPALNPRLISFAGAAAILSLLLVVPFQLHEVEGVISRHLAQLSPPLRPGNNVYFIRPRGGFYIADMVQIDPFLRDQDLRLVSRGGALDGEMIQRNWPSATLVQHRAAYDQWSLGPEDQRRAGRFTLAEPATLPSAADR